MSPYLQVVALLPMAVAAKIRRLERSVVRHATDARADTAARAIVLEARGKLGDMVHARLQRSGVLVSAGNDRYYFDAAAYAAFRRRRRTRAMIVLSVVAVVGAILYLRGTFS